MNGGVLLVTGPLRLSERGIGGSGPVGVVRQVASRLDGHIIHAAAWDTTQVSERICCHNPDDALTRPGIECAMYSSHNTRCHTRVSSENL